MTLAETIVGQEKMVKRVWEQLMDAGTGIMGLVMDPRTGIMGGVGKATLLEQISIKFLEQPVDGVEIVIFVVVSRELRVEMIQDAIAERLGFGGSEEWSRKSKIEKALVLHTSLRNMRFVLLLDDIWMKVDLKAVGVPYPTRDNGCKVVFTTRCKEVCGQMGVVGDPMELNRLESNEAWEFFRAKVGKITTHPDILELARQVAGKCHGLPLLLNIIGANMASKRTVEEWEQAVDTLASSSAAEEDDILPILKYSYDSLKGGEHVKSCFLYCALFPEDVSIEKERLVDYWICEGFIDENQGLKKAKNQGYGIVDTLVQACLLTEEKECESYVRMNDVVREMALWIASDCGKDKERCIVKAGARLREVPTVENWRSVRRMSLMDNEIDNISDSPTSPDKLTTLLFTRNKISNISGEFFKSMSKLVVLDLSHNRLVDRLPEEISKLVSLRYLDLSGNRGIRHLFTCLLELKKLIYLNLEETGLTSISGISNLSNLRTLRLRHNQTWRDINLIEELQLLEHLEMVTIGMGSVLVADQLVNAYRAANAIQVLSICFLEEKSILTLPDMPLLRTLDISQSKMVEINIITSSLNKSPTSTPSFPDLSTVILRDCHGLKDLTWLLLAPNLKALEVDSLNQVEDIISKEKAANILTEEEEEACTIVPFRKLEFFQVYGLPELKSIYWSPLPFPRLREFNIYNCPNLRKLPLDSTSGSSSIELAIHNGEQYYRDKVEWEDEATKERFLRCIKS